MSFSENRFPSPIKSRTSFSGTCALPLFKGFAASNEGMTGQPAITSQPAAGGVLRRIAQALDALTPAFEDAKDREFFRDLTVLAVAMFAIATVGYLATVDWTKAFPRDSSTLIVGRDFLNIWMYGRAALAPDPGRFYDVATYNHELAAMLGSGYPGQNWPNPPSFFLISLPFGALSFYPALLGWLALGIALFVAAARRDVADWRVLTPVVFSPAAMFCLISGQSSFLSAAALIMIFVWLDRRPILAGVLIGLLTVKPQLGLLFPFMLVAAGRWRVFGAAAVTALALIALTSVLLGPEVWVNFVTKSLPNQRAVLSDPNVVTAPFHATVFMNLRGLGASYDLGIAIQGIFAVFAVGAVMWAFRFAGDGDARELRALFLACAACTSPYLGIYDLLPLTFAAVVLLGSGRLDQAGRRLVQLIFWLPVLQLALGELRIPGPALIAPAFAAYLLMRLKARHVPLVPA
jgi:glycosyl transferase family 87